MSLCIQTPLLNFYYHSLTSAVIIRETRRSFYVIQRKTNYNASILIPLFLRFDLCLNRWLDVLILMMLVSLYVYVLYTVSCPSMFRMSYSCEVSARPRIVYIFWVLVIFSRGFEMVNIPWTCLETNHVFHGLCTEIYSRQNREVAFISISKSCHFIWSQVLN